MFTLAQKHSVAAIVCPGDLLDSPATGWGTVAELAEVLQGSPCPFLCINGNHDIYAGNPGSKYRTPYGFLARLGIIQELGEEPFESGDGDIDVNITGHGFNIETDTELGKGQFNPPQHIEAWAGASIHVVHSMLMDHSPGFDMRHILISQVETTADVIVCGHLHTVFGSKYLYRRDDGVLFINPGALCRLSAHHAEIERPVQVALLTVHEGKEIEAELIPLQCAAPGHEVLSRAHLEAEAERNDRLEKFLGLGAGESCLGKGKLLRYCGPGVLPGEVKAEALRRIGEARERLGWLR